MAGEFLALHVPGLAEGRPSVLVGDSVILTSPVETDGPQYEGIVHEVRFCVIFLYVFFVRAIKAGSNTLIVYKKNYHIHMHFPQPQN